MTYLLRIMLALSFLLSASTLRAEGKPTFEKPSYWEVATKLPESFVMTFEKSFSKDAILPWLAIMSTTAVAYKYDEEWLAEVKRWGAANNINSIDKTETYLEVGNIPLFRGPSDTGSALYYIGDGWTHFIIAGSLIASGEIYGNKRPLATGLQIIHGMTISTLFSQLLKRATGREAPIKQTEPRGAWRPFPSLESYWKDVTRFDAMPSGHVMTATHTFTVLYENYPEYRSWIVPIGSISVSLLGLQMMNNGVHWASDYPLAIGMGILFGRMSARLWRINEADQQTLGTHSFTPYVFNNTNGIKWIYSF